MTIAMIKFRSLITPILLAKMSCISCVMEFIVPDIEFSTCYFSFTIGNVFSTRK